MKNKNILMMLLTVSMISATFFLGCKKDGGDDDNNKTTGTIYITVIPDSNFAPVTSCAALDSSQRPYCEYDESNGNIKFNKARVALQSNNSSGPALFVDYISFNTKTSIGEYNAGDYDVQIMYHGGGTGDTTISGTTISFYGYTLLEEVKSFQVVTGEDKHVIIENW